MAFWPNGIQYILNYLTMEYWKITAIFPSRQSVFPSELLKPLSTSAKLNENKCFSTYTTYFVIYNASLYKKQELITSMLDSSLLVFYRKHFCPAHDLGPYHRKQRIWHLKKSLAQDFQIWLKFRYTLTMYFSGKK